MEQKISSKEQETRNLKEYVMNEFDQLINEKLEKIRFESITDHPNILIAAHFWDDERYYAAKICYKFMRMIDDLIDNRKAMEEEITCSEKLVLSEKVNEWIECLESTQLNDPFLSELRDVIKRFKVPSQLFYDFAKSMQHDIDHKGFSTFDEFIHYSQGASVAPASIFVHLCCLKKLDGEYKASDFDVREVARPCALFSYLVHIIRDFQKDQLNNLNYFALDILDKYNLNPENLRDIARGGPIPASFRMVVKEYLIHAGIYNTQTIMEIEKLKGNLSPQYLLSLYIIHSLYIQVYNKIDIEKGNFSTKELNPTPDEIKENVLQTIQNFQLSQKE